MSLAQEHYRIRKLLEEENVLFCYSGPMNEALLPGLGQLVKQKIAVETDHPGTVQNVFSILVEQIQNVIRYAEDRDTQALGQGTLTVGRDGEGFFVTCGNRVEIGQANRLREKLASIRAMDREELKAMYRQILKGEVPEGSKGAGVGFVDIARRSSQPIEFDFIPIDSNYSYFALKAVIRPN
ncbi:MAG: hypothetical protein HQM03_00215 [Magnetococcales bacterium]|nr:hypothetical protein [Magnetococcales bacterium]